MIINMYICMFERNLIIYNLYIFYFCEKYEKYNQQDYFTSYIRNKLNINKVIMLNDEAFKDVFV